MISISIAVGHVDIELSMVTAGINAKRAAKGGFGPKKQKKNNKNG